MERFDVVVIGGGVGLMVVEAAVNRNLKCAVIEPSKFGGTCLTKGCIPTKMLVYPADVIREAARARKIGLDYKTPNLRWNRIADRMWAQIGQCREIESSMKRIDGLTVFQGWAEFADSSSLKVRYGDGSCSEPFGADKIIIAAGARSAVPPLEGLEEAGFLTSETFFGDKFPQKPWKSLAVIGGGAIGTEFAHIFSAFGTKVTIIEQRRRLLSAEEEEISAFVKRQFENAGIRVMTEASVLSVRKSGRKKLLTVSSSLTKQQTSVESEEILVCSGIRPNSDTLMLKNTDIKTDEKGWIITDAFLKTSQENVWALGDINGKYQFRHKANFEAEILINNIFEAQEKKPVDYTLVPWAVFTLPQVAHVGLTQKQALRNGHKIMVGTNHYSEVAGGIAMGYQEKDADNGFFKLIVDEKSKILGAHIVGPHAAALLQPFVYLMNAGFKCDMATIPTLFPSEAHAEKFKDIRTMCPESGTYLPIFKSMVIHPSLNELTAWVIGKLRWSE